MKYNIDSIIGEVIGQAESFLRRHIKSKAVREAEKRQRKRRAEEAMRRVARAGAVTGMSGAALVGYTAAVAPVGTMGLIAAGGATLAAATATLMWPTRRRDDSGRDLDLLPALTEEWLLVRRTALPNRASPKIDAILHLLHDIQPHLAAIDPDSALAGDVRRLIGGHLPRLVDSYVELPATTRERRPEVAESLIASLGTVAEELARLCEEASRDRMHLFETQGRFIDMRYRDRNPLSGE